MKGTLRCLTLLEVEEHDTPEITARLREFTTNRGVRVEQAYPFMEGREHRGVVALVTARSQSQLDWFGSVVTCYAGVKSMSEITSLT